MVDVSGWHVGDITLYVTISNWPAKLEPYNTEHLLKFLRELQDIMAARVHLEQQVLHPVYVIVWDNVSFHHAVLIHKCFTNNQSLIKVFLQPYRHSESYRGGFIYMAVEGL